MTFLEQLQAHKGGLIRLKTQLYWYDGRRWDNAPGRVCLILDSAAPRLLAPGVPAATTRARPTDAAFFLIDGGPQWIWIAEADVELL